MNYEQTRINNEQLFKKKNLLVLISLKNAEQTYVHG